MRIERYSLCVIAQKKAIEPETPACSMKDMTPPEQKQPGWWWPENEHSTSGSEATSQVSLETGVWYSSRSDDAMMNCGETKKSQASNHKKSSTSNHTFRRQITRITKSNPRSTIVQ